MTAAGDQQAAVLRRQHRRPEVHAGDRTSRTLAEAVLAPGGVCAMLCDALDQAGPYGAGWPAPRVAAGPVRIVKADVVGSGHLRLVVAGDDGRRLKAIGFRLAQGALGQALLAAPAHRRLWIAGRVKRDDWNGGNAAELHLDDAAWAD